ncbi:MAG TPA: metallophosphoesterase [Abditibacteriaceae bacterium]
MRRPDIVVSHRARKAAHRESLPRVPFKKWAWRLSLWLGRIYQPLHDLQMMGHGVRVVHLRLKLEHFPSGAPPLRVAFLSDLHYGPTVGRLATLQAWQRVQAAHPDVILIGGDFLYGDGRGLSALRRDLQKIKARWGVYAVWGNHDYTRKDDESAALKKVLDETGVRLLRNEAIELPQPWQGVWIVGLDDPSYGDAQPYQALLPVPVDACEIFMSHAPDVYEFFPNNECDLTLCGDTHGGQICLPNGRPLWLNCDLCCGFIAGLYRPKGKYLWVSRGVGTVSLPLRLWAPPDVAIFDLS